MAKDLTVGDYEKLAIEATGLVPMRFLRGTLTDSKGDIAGFEPLTAKRMHDDGLAEPIDDLKASGSDTETDDGDDDADAERRSAVTIPEKWAEDHHLNRIKLAKEILGSNDSLKTEDADKAIQAELDRRAA